MTQSQPKLKEIHNIQEKSVPSVERFLFPEATGLLSTSKPTRINHVKNGFFVNYHYKKIIYQEIWDLFDQPIGPRMDGLLLNSPTNNGKTTLVKRFIEDNERKVNGKERRH